MNIKCVKVGFLQENCYILSIGNDALVIDPGDEYEKIKEAIGELSVKAILITHRHFDHIGALSFFKGVSIYEYDNLEEKKYKIGDFEFEVIFTSGHTSDSVSYFFESSNDLFTGDFLFKGTVGRTDLGGSIDDMMKSLSKIKKYSNSKIYPGHGDSTTMSDELESNPYFIEVI